MKNRKFKNYLHYPVNYMYKIFNIIVLVVNSSSI